MLGFLIGSACLVGLVATRRRGSCGVSASRCGSLGDSSRVVRCGRPGSGTFGRGGGMFGFLASLNLSRQQWKAARSATDDFRAEAAKHRAEVNASRDELGTLLKAATFDEGALGPMFARHDEVLGKLRPAFATLVAKVHATLEPGQRERLAEFVDLGPLGFAIVGRTCR